MFDSLRQWGLRQLLALLKSPERGIPHQPIRWLRGLYTLITLAFGIGTGILLFPERSDASLTLNAFLMRSALLTLGMVVVLFALLDRTFAWLAPQERAIPTGRLVLLRLGIVLAGTALILIPTLWLAGWTLGVQELMHPSRLSALFLGRGLALTLVLVLVYMLAAMTILHGQQTGLTPHFPDDSATTHRQNEFFVAGGTLQGNAPSYVRRASDAQLLEALQRGEFCYVLTSRQLGKSSLMVRTAQALRQAGYIVATIDLTAIGQNLTAEQWYYGLVSYLGQALDLEDVLEDFWTDHLQISPLQRWNRALETVVLPHFSGPIVIFVDEIDVVRSLPFSTDEFFANIRFLYNQRTEQPALNRLSFCLLGVATPADLIRDVRMTPFNIGRRIELTDFTSVEARGLLPGLNVETGQAEKRLERILYWTGGHPYLTQRLCLEVASIPPDFDDQGCVDEACQRLFLAPRARERDNNLLFVRERLLSSDVGRAELLELYRRVLRWPRRDEEQNPVVSALRLSGVVRTEQGRLKVRNRIYRSVFDPAWSREQLPDAERRRQRRAFLLGAGLAGAVATLLLSMALWANAELSYQREVAEQALERAEAERTRADVEREGRERSLYIAHINLAQQAWQRSNVGRMLELLELTRPSSTEKDLRGFEWFHLWHLAHRDALTLPADGADITERLVTMSADGQFLATVSPLQDVEIRKLSTGERLATLSGTRSPFAVGASFSPDGRYVLVRDPRGQHEREPLAKDEICRVEWATGKREGCIAEPMEGLTSAVFSPDGSRLAVGDVKGGIRLWEVGGRLLATLQETRRIAQRGLAFSPDGTLLASASSGNRVSLWSVPGGQRIHTLDHAIGARGTVAFSPRGDLLAASGTGPSIPVWNTRSWHEVTTFRNPGAYQWGLAFSPDGQTLASGSNDGTIRLWDLPHRSLWTTIRGHTDGASALGFQQDGKTLASHNMKGTVKVWPVQRYDDGELLTAHTAGVSSAVFSPDQRWFVSGGEDNSVRLWDVATRKQVASFLGVKPGQNSLSLAVSPDGRFLACGVAPPQVKDTSSGQLLVWEVATQTLYLNRQDLARGIYSVKFAPDGRTLATAGLDGIVRLWDVDSWTPDATLGETGQSLFTLSFSPDGHRLAGTRRDFTVRIWDMKTHQEIQRLEVLDPIAVAFSPDGRTLAVGTGFGMVHIWDARTFAPITAFQAHGTLLVWLAFSPDGRRLATGGRDHFAKLWDVETWQELITFEGHQDQIDSGTFSPDGRILATTSLDHTIRLWEAAPKETSESDQAADAPTTPPANSP